MKNYIGIDWGSTNLRAWLFKDDLCIDVIQSEKGVTRLQGESPELILKNIISQWSVTADMPIIMAGMVGSNAGWLPVPYLHCPLDLMTIQHQLTRVTTTLLNPVYIVPGVSIEDRRHCNVMRGEEVQLIGASQNNPGKFYVLPGTHSKWVEMDGSNMRHFSTMMTGELHHLLLNQSLVGIGTGKQQQSDAVFHQGLAVGLDDENIVRCLFEIRASHVLGRLEPCFVGEFLSGLLIGHEVVRMRKDYGITTGDRIQLVGNQNLSERYAKAMALTGLNYRLCDGDSMFKAGIGGIANALDN